MCLATSSGAILYHCANAGSSFFAYTAYAAPQTSSPHSPDNRLALRIVPSSPSKAGRPLVSRNSAIARPPTRALSHRQQTSPSVLLLLVSATINELLILLIRPHTGPHKTPASCKAQPFLQTRCNPPSRRPLYTPFLPEPCDSHPKQNHRRIRLRSRHHTRPIPLTTLQRKYPFGTRISFSGVTPQHPPRRVRS